MSIFYGRIIVLLNLSLDFQASPFFFLVVKTCFGLQVDLTCLLTLCSEGAPLYRRIDHSRILGDHQAAVLAATVVLVRQAAMPFLAAGLLTDLSALILLGQLPESSSILPRVSQYSFLFLWRSYPSFYPSIYHIRNGCTCGMDALCTSTEALVWTDGDYQRG